MSIISGTLKQESHKTYESRVSWRQIIGGYELIKESRENTTDIWIAVLDSISDPGDQGSGEDMLYKDFVPRINGWYDYTESWVTYGTWTT
jgi:hypothetical protein